MAGGSVKIHSPGSSDSSASDAVKRGIDMQLLIGGLNDGDGIPAPAAGFPGFARFQTVDPSFNYVMLLPTAGGTIVQSRMLDGRRVASWFNLAGNNSVWLFRPGGGVPWFLDFGSPLFQPLTSPLLGLLPAPQFGWATEVMAWCRKLNAGDGSSCRMGFGFANNTVTSPSGPIPRCGLMGDGAGGYRYGSVNCPDGLIGGANADGDFDVNPSQPADLVAPGANWWHTRLKMIPALPNQSARWAAYHNGGPARLFTQEANFPRGHQTTNDHYGRIEATLWNFSGDVGGLHVPELCFWGVRVLFHDDYSI
jgi:hypothetical protein